MSLVEFTAYAGLFIVVVSLLVALGDSRGWE